MDSVMLASSSASSTRFAIPRASFVPFLPLHAGAVNRAGAVHAFAGASGVQPFEQARHVHVARPARRRSEVPMLIEPHRGREAPPVLETLDLLFRTTLEEAWRDRPSGGRAGSG